MERITYVSRRGEAHLQYMKRLSEIYGNYNEKKSQTSVIWGWIEDPSCHCTCLGLKGERY